MLAPDFADAQHASLRSRRREDNPVAFLLEYPTDARVLSQSMCIVQPLLLFVADREVLHRRPGVGSLHIDAGQFLALVLVGKSPIHRFSVDDERPLVGGKAR